MQLSYLRKRLENDVRERRYFIGKSELYEKFGEIEKAELCLEIAEALTQHIDYLIERLSEINDMDELYGINPKTGERVE